MGSASSCKKCEPASTGSIVNLSDDCMERLSGGEPSGDQLQDLLSTQESNRMEKLRCIDDAHSASYGLTLENFEKLASRVEKLSQNDDVLPCARESIISCLKKNKCCMSECKDVMNEYIDCVDLQRINKIKNKMEIERKQQRRQEVNDLLQSSINSVK